MHLGWLSGWPFAFWAGGIGKLGVGMGILGSVKALPAKTISTAIGFHRHAEVSVCYRTEFCDSLFYTFFVAALGVLLSAAAVRKGVRHDSLNPYRSHHIHSRRLWGSRGGRTVICYADHH